MRAKRTSAASHAAPQLIARLSAAALAVAHLTARLSAAAALAVAHLTARLSAAAALAVALACGGDEARESPDLAMRAETAGPEGATSEPYGVAMAQDWGRIRGAVKIRGAARRDTVVSVHDEPRTCGAQVRVVLVRGARDRVSDAVVWVEGVRAGRPLPVERRFSVRYSRCRLEPRVQTAITGGMLMVRSADGIEHRTRIARLTDERILAVIRQGDAGSLVPVPDALAVPALLELRSEPRPWARAWIHVFDHPYHVVTRADGAFLIDSLPPGRHRIVVWHPRLGQLATDVALEPGGDVELDLVFEPVPDQGL